MVKKIDIGQKAKVEIVWATSQSDYSREQEKNIISMMAQKYGIPAKNIRVTPSFVTPNNDGVLSTESSDNIHDPKFMQELMQKYILEKGIKDIDFNEIVKIDSQINSLIDFDSYGKSKRYIIKWVKWSNFLSYGPDNYFDFRTLHGLVLLNGVPANKSGKSTFAYDLLHFLLFGKTNTKKAKTLGQLFNNYIPDAKTVNVEGCINIDGEDYIIRRTLTRPVGKKSKTITNKVEYYKLAPDGTETELSDDNLEGASATETSKIIKDALGNENDFDLIISANAKDLDSLISLTETEKGRLLSRWIGLSIIEDKDAIARNKWNKEISVGRYSDMYNRVQLDADINELTNNNKALNDSIENSNKIIMDCDSKIDAFNKSRDALLSSKQQIDSNLLKVDVVTLESRIKTIIDSGVRKKTELETVNKEIDDIGEIDYSEDDYRKMRSENEALISKMAEERSAINMLKSTNKALANAEYCPTCHRKLDNVDNSAQIKKNEEEIQKHINNGVEMKKKSDEIIANMNSIEGKRTLSQKKSQLKRKIF